MRIFLNYLLLIFQVDVLAWWKEASKEYPLLAEIAREYYCVPATSASSERSFSQAGLVVTSKRHNLNVKTIEMLCFVNQNYHALEPFVDEWPYKSETEIREPGSQSQDSEADPDAQDLLGPTEDWVPRRERLTEGKGRTPGRTPKRPRPDQDEPQAGPSSDTPKRPRH